MYRDGGGGEWASLLPKGDGRWGVKLQLDGFSQGRPVTVAHYWYQTTHSDSDGGRHRKRHALCVIAIRLTARYPSVELRERGLGLGWGLAVSQALGWQPANLTGTEDFDRRYKIHAEKPGSSALVTSQVVSAYLTSNLPLWQLSGDQLVITSPGVIRVGDLDQKLHQALTVAGLLDDSPATPP